MNVFRCQPRWAMPSLGLIVLAAVLLYTWNIGYSGLSTYYAASVKSMLANPRAVFFGAVDPNATITLDKLAGFLVPQYLSAKLFGFQPWALSLPQALEGAVTILTSYVIGTRWRGPAIGLAVAAIMAFTPTLAAMFGHPMEDGLLTMCMVLAFSAWQRALLRGSVGWLLASGVWVAVGFQAKMLQAWLILPALLIAYLVAAPGPLRRRIWQLAVAGGVTLVLSLSWMTAIQLVPPSQRPYIDGSTSNNEYSMVFGYDGVDRLVPGLVPGALPQLNASPPSGQSGSISAATLAARSSPAKLFLPQFSTQVGWFYPAAIVGCIGEIGALRRRRTPEGGVALALILWLFVTGVVLSVALVPHATYFAVLTLPLAALAVSGAVTAVRLYRRRGAGWAVLPSAIVAQAVWASTVAGGAAAQLRWLAPVIVVTGVLGSGALVVIHLRRLERTFLLPIALATASIATLIAPLTWSLCVLGPGGGGSASDAFAGPRLSAPDAATGSRGIANFGVHLRPPFRVRSDPGLDSEQQRLVDYVGSRNAADSISFATDTVSIAVTVIVSTHENPIPMGGFSHAAPAPAVSLFRELIDSGRLRFVLLATDTTRGAVANQTVSASSDWVRAHCVRVLSGRFATRSTAQQALFDCVAAER